ncbi:MAG: thiolase family protein [Oscillospiraceae bacterium]|nr:thiolase family protein [Oscillospiraceae bacterium]
MERKNAVIVAYGRSGIAKAIKGSLRYTGCVDFGSQVLKGILAKNPGFDPELAEDLICGCAIPEAEQGLNIGRLLADSSGFPLSTAGQTVNRFCSSGLQSIASAANAIMAGQARCIVAGGLENMSKVQMHRVAIIPDSVSFGSWPDNFDTMGITAENVAEKYGISRERQDAFSCESHRKAAAAIQAGKFKEEIIPVLAKRPAVKEDGTPGYETVLFDTDECVRADSTPEALAKLKPLFRMGGTVTAGNSSQMNDAAAFVILMEEEFAREQGLTPIARFVSFAVRGVHPGYMGIGPVEAIPKALDIAGMELKDIELIELNEAFAAQSLACIDLLGLDESIVNVNGGGIAFGHPLGCTGAYLTMKLIGELKRRGQKHGLVSMCIGGGMGAAGIFEMV